MQQPILIASAILLNVFAQVSIKLAGGTAAKSAVQQFLSPWLLLAVAFYGLSFLLTVRIYAVNQLSIAAPFMAACTFLLIYLLSYLLFTEPFTVTKSAGLILIVAGMTLLLR